VKTDGLLILNLAVKSLLGILYLSIEMYYVGLNTYCYVGKDIPAGSYKAAPNKWADGTRSDVVYSVRDKSTI
jgi:hypothetical protein